MATTAPRTNGRRTPRVIDALSETQPSGLAAALLAFHAEAPKLQRNATGQIQSRTYGYVTLDGMLDDVEPLLLKHELLWSAKVTMQDGHPAALYRMEHVPTGEHDEWTGPLPCVDPGPQALGSAITYMRRYTLQAYLNLAPGEDDDGAAASNGGQNGGHFAPQSAQSGQSSQPSPQPTAAAPKPSERQLSDAQRRLLSVRGKDLSAAKLANVVVVAKGEAPRLWDDEAAAKRWVDRELDRLPARLVDAVLEGIASCPPF